MKILYEPIVELVRHTPDPELALSEAYAVCRLKEPDIDRVVRCIKKGHLSPLEHVSYTFRLTVSRACWSQIQEYRTGKHTAQSHRVCFREEFILPKVAEDERWFQEAISTALAYYNALTRTRECAKEDARAVLPMCSAIHVIWTMDLRNLLHFWQERLAPEAQREIREVARKTLELVLKTLPSLASVLEGIISGAVN